MFLKAALALLDNLLVKACSSALIGMSAIWPDDCGISSAKARTCALIKAALQTPNIIFLLKFFFIQKIPSLKVKENFFSTAFNYSEGIFLSSENNKKGYSCSALSSNVSNFSYVFTAHHFPCSAAEILPFAKPVRFASSS